MKEKELAEQFSEETLNEMAMENLEGGSEMKINVPCNTNNCSCNPKDEKQE
jgi:hypothetical protein